MAFLGDFGKFFLGGASTGDVTGAATLAITGDPFKAQAAANAAQRGAELISASQGQLGQQTARSDGPPPTATENTQSGQENISMYNNPMIQPAILRRSMNVQQPQMMNPNIQQAFVRPGFQMGVAVGTAVIDLFFQDPITGETKRKRITRKFKSEVKQAVALMGIEAVAKMLETTPEVIVQILLKRFRNDGPYITKAAVRKTRTTVRKMERINELSREISKLAPTARRAATRRSSATSSTRKTIAIN